MKKPYKIVSVILSAILMNGCANTNHQKDVFINELIGKMTLDEKVGQMTQVDKRMLDSENDIAKYFLGSLLSGGGSVPDDNSPKG